MCVSTTSQDRTRILIEKREAEIFHICLSLLLSKRQSLVIILFQQCIQMAQYWNLTKRTLQRQPLFWKAEGDDTYMYTIRDARIWEHFKKIGPFKLPMVILLHFRVSQYKCKTNYCEKKEWNMKKQSCPCFFYVDFLAGLDVLPITSIYPSWRTQLLFHHSRVLL